MDLSGLPHRAPEVLSAPVAQLDRACASEAQGRVFESLRAHHFSQYKRCFLKNAPVGARPGIPLVYRRTHKATNGYALRPLGSDTVRSKLHSFYLEPRRLRCAFLGL